MPSQTVTSGKTAAQPTDPARSGHFLEGWYSDSGLLYRYNFASPVTANITLHAKWEALPPGSALVTFNSNGGSHVDSQVITSGGTASRPANPSRDSHTFVDWYSDSGLINLYSFSTPVTANITLYAGWTATSGEPEPTPPPVTFTTIGEAVSYLESQSGGAAPSDPLTLTLDLSLGDMADAGDGWQSLLAAIAASGKYVELDLSECTMSDTKWVYTNVGGEDKITGLILPDTITSIANSTYYISDTDNDHAFGCFTNLTQVTLPAGLQSIGNSAFYGLTHLTELTLPTGLQSIGEGAFIGCAGLTQVNLPAGLQSIGNFAFASCTGLTQVTLPASLTSIGTSVFIYCASLAQVTLPTSLTSIGNSAFSYCASLTQVNLPASLQSIGEGAFRYCAGLTQVALPAGLQSIGNLAFNDCTSLMQVTCEAIAPPTLGSNVFSNTHASLQIKVPAGSVTAYQGASEWNAHAGKIVALP